MKRLKRTVKRCFLGIRRRYMAVNVADTASRIGWAMRKAVSTGFLYRDRRYIPRMKRLKRTVKRCFCWICRCYMAVNVAVSAYGRERPQRRGCYTGMDGTTYAQVGCIVLLNAVFAGFGAVLGARMLQDSAPA